MLKMLLAKAVKKHGLKAILINLIQNYHKL